MAPLQIKIGIAKNGIGLDFNPPETQVNTI